MIPRIRNLFTAIAAAVLLSVFLPGDPAAAQSGKKSASSEEAGPALPPAIDANPADKQAMADALMARAQEHGKVMVIVELEVEGSLVGATQSDSPEAVGAYRKQVADAQAALTRRIGAEGTSPQLYDNLPMMALTVTPAGLEALAKDTSVSRIFENRLFRTQMNESLPVINADDQHNVSPQPIDGMGTAVAILDTGTLNSHEFLSPRVFLEACFSTTSNETALGVPTVSTQTCPSGTRIAGDGSGFFDNYMQVGPGAAEPCGPSGCSHGSHVSGTAAGFNTGLSGGEPVKGVAPGAGIIGIQVFSDFEDTGSGGLCGGTGATCALSFGADQLNALDWLITQKTAGVNVVSANMSLGGGGFTSHCDGDPLKPAIDTLRGLDVLTAIAAGNSGFTDAVGAPGCISTAITVGAVSENDDVTCYTNEGHTGGGNTLLDVWAPGGQAANLCSVPTDTLITSSVPPSGYAGFQGTSMATPHVAGAIALLKDRYPAATANQVETALENGVTIVSPFTGATAPRINLNTAMSYLAGQFPKPQPLGALAPNARAGVVTGTNVVTAFFSFFNGANGNQPLNDCVVGIPPQVPADFRFRQLDQNTFAVIGGVNEPIDLAQNEAETVLLVFDPTAPIDPHESVPIQFHCSDSPSGNNIPFTNHFTLSANDPQPADVLVSLIEHDDPNSLFITIPGSFSSEHVFINFLNIGSGATLHFTVDDGGKGLGMTGTACLRRFNFPGDTGCAGASQSVTGGNSYSTFVAGGTTLLQLTLTLNSNGAIPQSVFNRVFVRARTGSASGTIRGTNSLAVYTQ